MDYKVVEEAARLRLQEWGIEYGMSRTNHKRGLTRCVANQCITETISIYTFDICWGKLSTYGLVPSATKSILNHNPCT